MGISSVSLNLSSGITQAGYAARLEWTRGNLQWNGGVEYNYYHFRPMQFEVSGSFIENETPKFREDAHEANAYLQPTFPSAPLVGTRRIEIVILPQPWPQFFFRQTHASP